MQPQVFTPTASARALLVLTCGLGFTLPTLASTQIEEDVATRAIQPAGLASALGESVGLASRDDGWIAGGPDYRARFTAGTVQFTPALGKAAPTTLPLSFTLEEIERGGVPVLSADQEAWPERDGDSVVYHRAGGIEERYDVTAPGLEQSFLFPTPLAGSGDLVVRGRIDTDLSAFPAQRLGEGPLFELPGVGGVRFGTVTGIDADGDRVTGSIRLAGTQLELVLPGDFVDGATYPLLLDPLIGSEIGVSAGGNDDGDPEVAFDSTEQVYLVVFERIFSLTDGDIRAQRVDKFGTPLGGTLFLSSGSSTIASDPAVGNVNAEDTFLVAWEQSVNVFSPRQIVAMTVDAADGSLSAELTVDPSANNQFDPAVSGERTTTDDDVLIVWQEQGVGIRLAQVTSRDTSDPFVVGSAIDVELDSATYTNSRPSISRSGGDPGRSMVVWTRVDTSGEGDIEGTVVDRNANILQGDVRLAQTISGADDVAAVVDGDGDRWVLAWERAESLGAAESDIYARPIRWFGTALAPVGGEIAIENDPDDDEFSPSIAWVGDRAVLAHVDANFSSHDLYVKVLDPFTCEQCESEIDLVVTSGIEETVVAVGSEWHGGGTGTIDDAFLVWESLTDGEDDSDILGYRYDARTAPTDLGGGCGDGGVNYNPCAFDGNANFTVQLEDADPFSTAVFLVSLGQAPFNCGPCTLFPAFDGSEFVIATATDATGKASLNLPMPLGVADIDVYSQWAVQTPGGCPSFTQWGLSNALMTPIQQD